MTAPDPLTLALGMPKAELHVHIEGTLEPELAFALARRNGITLPYADEAALKAAYAFDSLQSFLDLYYACADVLRTREDFYDLMLAYLKRAAADKVIHVEVFFDPQTHTARGIPFTTVLEGLEDGLAEGLARYGISGRLILCFLRHLPEEECLATLAEVEPWLERIHGFGLDSSEKGHPPSKFVRLFARCRELGKPVVAHAGEEGPPAYITEALDLLGAQRIDHGVRAVEDEAVLARLVREGIPLTVCPLSNTRLCVFARMSEHTLPRLLAAGARVTLNSDDPAYFGGYLNDNIRAVQEAFHFDAATWYRLARNSFEASFAKAAEKAGWIARLDKYFVAAGVPPGCG
ncbi:MULTISPECIES: adenosine deaminase [Zoogloea]|jgi:adenosine deaminase|uniref:adenosine deaminase n=1 Tax=Zoogloea TaxID=349 RepID=UPI00258EC7E4|nr:MULTISPECIES: adenosine deaminase [Zoogloea]MDD2669187.1 adenosine deaminase [Zoogloea sp.]MDY0034878.1 adenosine deaminase [Zoogloea oleivorans]